MKHARFALALALALTVAATFGTAWAWQEHPTKSEHPAKEHPAKEHPAAKPATTADIEAAIRADVDAKSKDNNGRYPVKDDVAGKVWQLALTRVHTDKLTQLKENKYFACVDFKADDGTMVDVDFYLKGKEGKLAITETSVHKINGQARYMYQQKGNFWERVPAAAAKAEHPQGEQPKKEHPKQ